MKKLDRDQQGIGSSGLETGSHCEHLKEDALDYYSQAESQRAQH